MHRRLSKRSDLRAAGRQADRIIGIPDKGPERPSYEWRVIRSERR
jgi:hypothetical protein